MLQNILKNSSSKDLTCGSPAPATTASVVVIFHLSFQQRMEDSTREKCCLVHTDCITWCQFFTHLWCEQHIADSKGHNNSLCPKPAKKSQEPGEFSAYLLFSVYWYYLRTALSVFQVIYYTTREVCQTRHQLRILLFPVFYRENLNFYPMEKSIPMKSRSTRSSSPVPCGVTPSSVGPPVAADPFSASCHCLQQYCAESSKLFHHSKGANITVHWQVQDEVTTLNIWFSIEFLFTTQILSFYAIKFLQEARAELDSEPDSQAIELDNSCYLYSGC